jgi:MFS family permease
MTLDVHATLTYRRLFAVAGFPRLAGGAFLARAANQMWQVTLVLFVLQRFKSPTLAGLTVFLSILPGLLVSPLAGALLDRHGRARLILVDYLFAAISIVVLVALDLAGALVPASLLLIVALTSLTRPLSATGTRSLFPLVVPPELWDRANAVDSGSDALSLVVGPAIAGLLVAWTGGIGALALTAALFAAAAATMVGLPEPSAPHEEHSSLLRASWAALIYVVRNPTLRGLMFAMQLVNLAVGVLIVALPVLVFQRYHAGADAAGSLWGLAGIATVGAGLVLGRFSTLGRERVIFAAGMTLCAAGCLVLTLAHSVAALLLGMFLVGLSFGPVDISLFALRQRRTDPAWFGRAFAVSMSLNYAGTPAGAALSGPLLERSLPLALLAAVITSAASGVVALVAVPRAK